MILTKKRVYKNIFNGPSILLIHFFSKLQASLVNISFNKDNMVSELNNREKW